MIANCKKYLELLYKSRSKPLLDQKELVADISRRGFLRQIIDITLFGAVAHTCCALPSEYSKFLPDLGDSDRANLSPSDANFLGQQIISDISSQGDVLQDYDFSDYINNLGDNLVSYSPLSMQAFNFYGLKGKEINAFALPGGYICIYNGLVYTAQSEAELASVVSHEIGHIVQHHIFRNIAIYNRNQWLSMAGILAGALLAPINPGAAIIAANGGQGLAVQNILSFSRDFEREADRVGQGIMYNADFDPHAMPQFFARMAEVNRFNNNEALAFLQTHPVNSERISEAQERANQLPLKMRADSLSFLIIREKCRTRQLGPSSALNFYQQAIKTKRYNNINTQYYGIAFAYLGNNNPIATLAYLHKITDSHLINHPAYFSLKALAYSASKSFSEARRVYEQGLSAYPDYKGLWIGQVDMEIRAKELKQAAKYLLGLAQQYPNDLDIWSRTAYIYADSNLNNPYRYYYALGNQLYIRNDYKGALEKYKLAINVAKKNDSDTLDDIISSKIIDLQERIKFNAMYGG
jgi:predicted Zn-dependent protease